jgi:hypothetical protein
LTPSNGKLLIASAGVASTDFIPQGATNLYSTINSVSNVLSAGNNIKINSSGGSLQINNGITSTDLVPPGATNLYTTLNSVSSILAEGANVTLTPFNGKLFIGAASGGGGGGGNTSTYVYNASYFGGTNVILNLMSAPGINTIVVANLLVTTNTFIARPIGAPTNNLPGFATNTASLTINLIQDGNGKHSVTFDPTAWKFPSGVIGAATTNANAIDVISGVSGPFGSNVLIVQTFNFK